MKKLLLLLGIIAFGYSSNAQAQLPVDSETKLVSYNEVVNMPGVSSKELYTRAVKWFHK